MEKPKLQVALDSRSIAEAMYIMRNGLDRAVDIVEVGTYLILAEGLKAIAILRAAYPDKLLVADYNSVDPAFGEMVLDQGAQLNTINSVTSDEMMEQSLQNAKRRGQIGQICIYDDRLTMEDAEKWRRMGAEYIVYTNYHGKWLPGDVEKVKKLCDMGYHVSIADGVVPDTLELFAGIPLYAVVMGGAICKAEDPVEAARQIQNKIQQIWGN